jgi:hypothetical protein
VLSVNHEERIAVVSWRLSAEEAERAAQYADTAAGGADARVEERREVVPVYDIAPHPDFGFKVGDVVLRLPMGDKDAPTPAGPEAAERTAAGAEQVRAAPSGGAAPVESSGGTGATRRQLADAEADGEDGAEEASDAPADGGLSALSWVGEVVDVGPTVCVRWMDGRQTRCAAESLYMVNTEEEEAGEEEVGSFDEGEGEAGSRGGDAEGGDNSSGWETVDSEASNAAPHTARSHDASADRTRRRPPPDAPAGPRQLSDAEAMTVSSDEEERGAMARAGLAAVEGARLSAPWAQRVPPLHLLPAATHSGSAAAVQPSTGSSEDEANYATAEEVDDDMAAAMDEGWPPAGQAGVGAGRGVDAAEGSVRMQTDASPVPEANSVQGGG